MKALDSKSRLAQSSDFSKDPIGAELRATTLLRECTYGKTLILFCENLTNLFRGLGDKGQKQWRAMIQEDGNWAIVTSAPSLFAGLVLQRSPFYGFFAIRSFEEIDFNSTIKLFSEKAKLEQNLELANFF